MAGPSARLFISCVSGEFGAYRDALRQALTRPNVEVKIQEDFKALGGDTLHMLEDYIEQCEAVVHFVGDTAGSTPARISVDDLLARRPDLQDRLKKRGLANEALAALTYTQWEAWLAIGFDKDLLIVAPVPRANSRPSDASRESQADHLQRLKAIDRYPIKFTNADNLVAKIVNGAVIDALLKAQAPLVEAKGRELFGAMVAVMVAVVSLFAMFIAYMLPGQVPIFIRILAAGTVGLFLLLLAYYWYILIGADDPKGSRECADYDALLAKLRSGGTPEAVYRDWLTKALDRVDTFFGDPERNDKSWFARILGLETPGARWTAPAFDRCLLLALIYPIVTIYFVWIWSGHVGVAERALSLWETPSDNWYGGLRRSALGPLVLVVVYAAWRFGGSTSTAAVLKWLALACIAGAAIGFDVRGAPVTSGAAALSLVLLALVGPYRIDGPGVVAGILAFGFGFAVANNAFFYAPFAFLGGLSVATAVTIAIQIGYSRSARRWFLLTFFILITVVPFVGALVLTPLYRWGQTGPLLLLFGVLTLVNAPFDWFAIGLTRALLRRGLAPGGRGPYFYAAVDALVAIPVIALLAFVSVFAVQTFDDIAALRAGSNARIMPLDTLFAGLDAHPGNPEYWWVWLMLFSTLIPSAINLCIAAASLVRGLPFLNTWIVKRMQAAEALRDSDRLLLASALSAQIAGGVLATGVALYLIGVWFLPIWLPFLGGYARDFSEALAANDAPARIMMWFAGVR
jgi:hypothetical protein